MGQPEPSQQALQSQHIDTQTSRVSQNHHGDGSEPAALPARQTPHPPPSDRGVSLMVLVVTEVSH